MDHYETGLTGRLWEERRVADEACCSERLPHLSWPDRIEHYHRNFFTALCFAVTMHLRRCGAIDSEIHRKIKDGRY